MMALDAHEALARTTLLINREFFAGEADEKAIADALLESSVRIAADEANVSTLAGQTCIATVALLCARMGLSVELAFPEADLQSPQPPLRGPLLRHALTELGHDLIPGARSDHEASDSCISFVVGDTPCEEHASLRLLANNWQAEIVAADVSPDVSASTRACLSGRQRSPEPRRRRR